MSREGIKLTDAQRKILRILSKQSARTVGMYLQQISDIARRDKTGVKLGLYRLMEYKFVEKIKRKNFPENIQVYRITSAGLSHLNNKGRG